MTVSEPRVCLKRSSQ